MSAFVIRPETDDDHAAIFALVERAFGQPDEAKLIDTLRSDGDVALSLVAERNGTILGRILFSPLIVEDSDRPGKAVALAPIAVDPDHQRSGVGSELIRDAHVRLKIAGVALSVVLGDPAYYGRLGYRHPRAESFDSDYQSDALQAFAVGEDAPTTGRLVYAKAFGAL